MIEKEGILYARVSEVIVPFVSFSNIDPLVLQAKAQIGTDVHETIEAYIETGFPFVDTACKGYFESFLKWQRALKPKFHHSEERYFCPKKRICGKIDCLAEINSGVYTLVDFKTSVQESKETWPMQAHLYHYLLSQNGITLEDKMLFVKLNKFGNSPEVFVYKWNQNIMAKCFNAIDCFWEKQKYREN